MIKTRKQCCIIHTSLHLLKNVFLQHKIKLKQANVHIFFILFLIDSNLQSVKYYANSCFILNVIKF